MVQDATYWLGDQCKETQLEQQADLMCEFCVTDVGGRAAEMQPWKPLAAALSEASFLCSISWQRNLLWFILGGEGWM